MAQIDITRMSSKGQIVIPADLRKGIDEGDKLVIIRSNDQIIIKKADKFDENIAEELEFARRTEAAYKRIEQGKYKRMEFDEFIKEMRTW
ncbi:AbrB/MazE/SpoVT family DNA-binding domain-containing protein [Candidatus Pacearchaeota archaeon]|nr:AbrB/MazE/SpoVT family DNA-binding domain-containing protein [Candidatus Pacearchaeota archaeon]